MADLRLFIAATSPPVEGVRACLNELEKLRPLVSPVAPEQFHATLRFLGDTPEERVPELSGALEAAAERAGVEPFELHLARVGCFPERGRRPPRVIWAAPADPQPLIALAEAVSEELAMLDPPIPPDQRGYSPHLTLARVKVGSRRPRRRKRRQPRYQRDRNPEAGVDRVRAFLEAHAEADLGRVRVEAIGLYASELTPQGAVHRLVHGIAMPTGEPG
ncbi:MAG: RNA 2',3'-cyclic phosphodiesterase [Phycisphaeraceae bacterium]